MIDGLSIMSDCDLRLLNFEINPNLIDNIALRAGQWAIVDWNRVLEFYDIPAFLRSAIVGRQTKK
jgi:hypothetical protein